LSASPEALAAQKLAGYAAGAAFVIQVIKMD
jgi:hypothetical protein